jgi:hypothetical protein
LSIRTTGPSDREESIMTELQTPDHAPRPTDGQVAKPRDRRRVSALALVASGLLAGGVLASTMNAGAATTEPEPGTTTDSRDLAPRGPGGPHHRTPLDSATAAQVEAAITAAYPGATVLRMGALPDGGYAALIVDADDSHVAVTLDESFAVSDSTTLPAPLDSATAAAVEDAVLAEYPGATVIRIGALPEGGYAAHLVTSSDEHVAVRLDQDLIVTGELTPDDIRQGASDRLGQLGARLERRGDHLGALSERIDRLRERLDRDGTTDGPTDDATAQGSGFTA